MENILQQPIEYLKGVGPARAELLKKELNIFSFGDLLQHYPFRYMDKSKFQTIKEIDSDEKYFQIKGTVISKKTIGENRQKRLVATLKDESGVCELVWFKGVQWTEKNIEQGKEYVVYGKPQLFNNRYNFPHPEIELLSEVKDGSGSGLFPVYPTTEKLKQRFLTSKAIAKLQKTLLQQIKPNDLPEVLPPAFINDLKLMMRFDAMQQIHFPQNSSIQQQAEKRLKFEELFLIQLRLLKSKSNREHTTHGFVLEKIDGVFDEFYKNNLPFELTNAQKRVVREIRKDVLSGKQMNRLIQGDVGSGKTVVALMSMLMAVDNGFQACMMAPTEILAQQHFEGISTLLKGMNLNVAILTGSAKTSERKFIQRELESGEIKILIGTHALIEDAVQFKNLGLAVVDEQHKFGVQQRAALWKKNQEKPPHILVMTATPIPRTLAMTLYGDLDSSVIDELPPGRKAIKTIHKFDSHRLALFGFLKEEIAKGMQVYIVYPLIEESEKMQLKDLMDGYESISREFPLPHYKISIVHGRQKSEDKEIEMQKFVKGETQIMVATTVIEVGVNVPNASVMVVESAERFGLSQLHQLRGRVGRGAEQSYCILMTGNKLGADARKRMRTMCDTNDGFIIAEVDLELRGPGDMEGLQQSGVVNLHIANLAKDQQILQTAREKAQQLIEDDWQLEKPEHQRLKQILAEIKMAKKEWGKIS